ncbi:MAG TPA: YncE family protein [Kofleriaceae bacterium]|nr:YncE family protein [Kofleriaceae bacterium]
MARWLLALCLLAASQAAADRPRPAARWRVVETLPAGSMPWGVIARDGSVYVAHVGYAGRDNVFRYDARKAIAARARFPGHAVELALSRDGKTLYAGNSRKDLVMALDAATLAVKKTYATGSGPKDLCLSPDERTIYAGNFNTSTISVLPAGGGPARLISVGDGPRGLDTSADGKKLYVASLRAGTVSVIDTTSLRVQKTIPGCRGAAHTALTPDGKRLLVTCYGAKHVQVIDTATDEPLRLIEVERGPNPIAVTPDGRFALVGNEFASSLSTIDLTTWEVTTMAVPIDRPTGLFVDPTGRRAYLTGRGTPKLLVLEPAP